MPCDPLINPACIITKVIAPVTGAVTGGILGGIAQAIGEGIRWIVVNTATWWVQIPSPNLATEPAVTRIQAWLLPITVAIGIGGVIAAGLRMALTRRANPLLDVSSGLLALAAAGAVAPLTRPWIRKISSWMLALICYKPAAAAVYAAAFTMIGSGHGTRTVLMASSRCSCPSSRSQP